MSDAIAEQTEDTAAQTSARDRIVDAAAQCFRRFGVTKTTLEDIAEQAGTSRATIYRTIPGGRDEIVLTVLLRESAVVLEPLRAELEAMSGFEEQLVEGVARAIELGREHPNLQMLFTAETVMSSVVVPGAWAAVVQANEALLSPLTKMARERGELRPELTDAAVSEWLCRIILSIFVAPAGYVEHPTELRAYLRTFMVPSLVNDAPQQPTSDAIARAAL